MVEYPESVGKHLNCCVYRSDINAALLAGRFEAVQVAKDDEAVEVFESMDLLDRAEPFTTVRRQRDANGKFALSGRCRRRGAMHLIEVAAAC